MRPVKLVIDGSFWDSQIYSGELMVLGDDGCTHKIAWEPFIDQIAARHKDMQTAIRVAFSDSDLFYNPKVAKILRDPIIEAPIKLQLDNLSLSLLEPEKQDIKNYWHTERSPFNFLPTDTEIYYNQIFAGGDEGLFSYPRHASTKRNFSNENLVKHHDAEVFQIKASDRFTAIAIAAGRDGMFDFGFSKNQNDKLSTGRQIAENPCSACDWAFQSVMGWSSEEAFLASFREEKDPNNPRKKIRIPDRVIAQSEIFGETGTSSKEFVWGSREKMYRLGENGISISKYNSSSKSQSKGRPRFESIGFVDKFHNNEIISTGTAPFGTVIELMDRLIVLRSDGVTEEFIEAPVHWRVFPRSENYNNQLHIIYEDRLEIISFVHDYFVDQENKLFGFSRGSNEFFSEEVDTTS